MTGIPTHQLQRWYTILKLTGTIIAFLVCIIANILTLRGLVSDVGDLKTSVNTLKTDLSEDQKDTRRRIGTVALAFIEINGNTPNGKKIIESLQLEKVLQP